MISKPILFSGPMVPAILEGRKTQTRRIVKPQPSAGVRLSALVKSGLEDGHGREIRQRIFVGDSLWVKETCSVIALFSHHRDGLTDSTYRIEYRAGGERHIDYSGPSEGDKEYARAYDRQRGEWRPSIFMPRWASRLTLKVADVRIQRLNVISEADALAEGCKVARDGCYVFPGTRSDDAGIGHSSAVMAYAGLWDEINGADSWNENPWVWAYTFEVTR